MLLSDIASKSRSAVISDNAAGGPSSSSSSTAGAESASAFGSSGAFNMATHTLGRSHHDLAIDDSHLLRILLVGDVKGKVNLLRKKLLKLLGKSESSNNAETSNTNLRGKFDVVFCVGEFSAEEMEMDDLEAVWPEEDDEDENSNDEDAEKEGKDEEEEKDVQPLHPGGMPIPVYFVDSGCATQDLIEDGSEELYPNLTFLGHSGVRKIEIPIGGTAGFSMTGKPVMKTATINVAGLSGRKVEDEKVFRESEELFVDGKYTKLAVDRLHEELELEENVDFFLCSESCDSDLVLSNRPLQRRLTTAVARESIPKTINKIPSAIYPLKQSQLETAIEKIGGSKKAELVLSGNADSDENKQKILSFFPHDPITNLVDLCEPRYFVCSWGKASDGNGTNVNGTANGTAPGDHAIAAISSFKSRPAWRKKKSEFEKQQDAEAKAKEHEELQKIEEEEEERQNRMLGKKSKRQEEVDAPKLMNTAGFLGGNTGGLKAGTNSSSSGAKTTTSVFHSPAKILLEKKKKYSVCRYLALGSKLEDHSNSFHAFQFCEWDRLQVTKKVQLEWVRAMENPFENTISPLEKGAGGSSNSSHSSSSSSAGGASAGPARPGPKKTILQAVMEKALASSNPSSAQNSQVYLNRRSYKELDANQLQDARDRLKILAKKDELLDLKKLSFQDAEKLEGILIENPRLRSRDLEGLLARMTVLENHGKEKDGNDENNDGENDDAQQSALNALLGVAPTEEQQQRLKEQEELLAKQPLSLFEGFDADGNKIALSHGGDDEEARRWRLKFGFVASDLSDARRDQEAKRRKYEEWEKKQEEKANEPFRKSLYHNQKPLDRKKHGRDHTQGGATSHNRG